MTQNKNINSKVLKDVMRMTTLCTGMVKAMCAMPNNVSCIMLYNAYEFARKHPAYKQKTKQLYKHTMETYMAYERRLCRATNYRMFEVADLAPEARKRYGNITNEDYFTLWQAELDMITSSKRNMQLWLDGTQIRYRNHERDKKGKLTKCEAYFVERETITREVK